MIWVHMVILQREMNVSGVSFLRKQDSRREFSSLKGKKMLIVYLFCHVIITLLNFMCGFHSEDLALTGRVSSLEGLLSQNESSEEQFSVTCECLREDSDE